MKQDQKFGKFRRCMPILLFITFALLVISLAILVIALCCNNKQVKSNDNEAKTERATESFEDSATTKKAKLSAEGPSDTYYYDISEEEKVMIAKLVWAEARGESYEGKVAVAAVVLNRYRFEENDYDFDNESISSIILQKNQFASISKATSDELAANPDCMKAVEDACKGYDPTRETFENGALYFYNPKYVKGEEKEKREGIKIMVIGNHNFHYDFKKVE